MFQDIFNKSLNQSLFLGSREKTISLMKSSMLGSEEEFEGLRIIFFFRLDFLYFLLVISLIFVIISILAGDSIHFDPRVHIDALVENV